MTPEIPITPEHDSRKRSNTPIGRRTFAAFAVMTGGLVAGNHVANTDIVSEPAPSISDIDTSSEMPPQTAPLPSFPVAEVYSDRDVLSQPAATVDPHSEDYSLAATGTVIEPTITHGSVIGSGISEAVGQSAILDSAASDEILETGIHGPATVSEKAVRGGSKKPPTTVVKTSTTTSSTTTTEVPTTISTTTTSSSSVPSSTTTTEVPTTTSSTTSTTSPETTSTTSTTTSTTTTSTPETTTTTPDTDPDLRKLPDIVPMPESVRSYLRANAGYSQELGTGGLLLVNADGTPMGAVTVKHGKLHEDNLVRRVDKEGNSYVYYPNEIDFGPGEQINMLNNKGPASDLYLPNNRNEDVAVLSFDGSNPLSLMKQLPRKTSFAFGETAYTMGYPARQNTASGVVQRQELPMRFVGTLDSIRLANGDVIQNPLFFLSIDNENDAMCTLKSSGSTVVDKDKKVTGVISFGVDLSNSVNHSYYSNRFKADLPTSGFLCGINPLPTETTDFIHFYITRVPL